jgi:uncharacterized C2H2 Zn-finger protein
MNKTLSSSIVIQRSIKVHGERYIYDKVDYKNSKTNIVVGCKEQGHGYFQINFYNHLKGFGCPKCGKNKKRSQDEFVKELQEIHGDQYDYSQTVFKDMKTPILIICRLHGKQTVHPQSHLYQKAGCKTCGILKQVHARTDTKEDYVRKAEMKWGVGRFDYTDSHYINNHTKITIRCIEHDEIFTQVPSSHLVGYRGCIGCGKVPHYSSEQWIERFQDIHGDKYDYSEVASHFKNCDERVPIICTLHGTFWMTPYHHYNRKQNCGDCCGTKNLTTPIVIQRCIEKHGDRYIYDKVNYINDDTEIEIGCVEEGHGYFMMLPRNHYKLGCHCPKCSKVYQRSTEEFVENAKKVHGEDYNYNNTVFVNCKTNVEIHCPKHGIFTKNPSLHLNGSGCNKCNPTQYSNIACDWLDHIAKQQNIHIEHGRNGQEKVIIGGRRGRISVDGYCQETNTVYEFQGCYTHGCQKCYSPEWTNPHGVKGIEKRLNDFIKQHRIRLLGYSVVMIWECDARKELKNKSL